MNDVATCKLTWSRNSPLVLSTLPSGVLVGYGKRQVRSLETVVEERLQLNHTLT